jgi:putative peptidoglycan lipid II flippase
MLISLLSIAINYTAVLLMIQVAGLGHAGLALSTSIVALFSFVSLFLLLRGRIAGMYGRDLVRSFYKVVAASLSMGGAVALTSWMVHAWLGERPLAHLIDLTISIPVGLGVYYIACRVLQLGEIDMAMQAFARPLLRQLPGRRSLAQPSKRKRPSGSNS